MAKLVGVRTGKDWIYCALNNYGGNNGVFGLLETELKAPAAAHAKVAAQGLDNMVGVGLTMEGIDTNCKQHGRRTAPLALS